MKALILCAYRELSLPTFASIMNLSATQPNWHVIVEAGDALVSRVRSIAASRWLREYPNDEAFVMTDDDFQFSPQAAEDVIKLAIEKRGIAAGVTPLRSGTFTAIVPLSGKQEDAAQYLSGPPREIKWAGGFLAYHRSVFEAMAKTLPLLHENDTMAAFWPFFMPMVAEIPDGRLVYLSEDYACHQRARELGFKIWVQPSAHIDHLGAVMTTTRNMAAIRALNEGRAHIPSDAQWPL